MATSEDQNLRQQIVEKVSRFGEILAEELREAGEAAVQDIAQAVQDAVDRFRSETQNEGESAA